MDKITINPQKCIVYGNVIGYEKGYLESDEDFQSHKCEVSINQRESLGFDPFDVYSFSLTPNNNLSNAFNDNIAFCKPASLNSLFVCEHFYNQNKSDVIFDINQFTNGYKFTVKESYLNSNNVDLTAPFFLLILQNNTGVSIPNGASTVLFSSTIDASPYISSIKICFVFLDAQGNLLTGVINPTTGIEVGNEATGNNCRISASSSIPNGAKYVGVEFLFENGVGKHIVDDVTIYDYLSLELNCLLFDQLYGGFVRNE